MQAGRSLRDRPPCRAGSAPRAARPVRVRRARRRGASPPRFQYSPIRQRRRPRQRRPRQRRPRRTTASSRSVAATRSRSLRSVTVAGRCLPPRVDRVVDRASGNPSATSAISAISRANDAASGPVVIEHTSHNPPVVGSSSTPPPPPPRSWTSCAPARRSGRAQASASRWT